MLGFLVDGVFILASEIAAIEYLYLQGASWYRCTSLEQFNGTAEEKRAIRYTLKNGVQLLMERPKKVKRDDLNRMMA